MAKGSISDPYTLAEYEKMVKDGTWKGGYVIDDQGETSYAMAEVTMHAYSGSGTGSGSNKGSSSDFQFDSYKSFQGDPGLDDDDDDDDDGPGGSVGNGGNNGNNGRPSGGNGGHSGGDGSSNNSGYNVSSAVNYLTSHAYPAYDKKTCGKCATAVREALEAGGLSTVGHPNSACDYDTFLIKKGFRVVDKNNYSPKKGDIIVLEAVEGHKDGHIAMYSGSKWISDFVQRDMWGGSAYRNIAEYTLLRR